MKKHLALAVGTLLTTASATADETRHMIGFDAQSILNSAISLTKTKNGGQNVDDRTRFRLTANYAYSLMSMPRLQLAGRINYDAQTRNRDTEDYGFQIGAYLNHSDDLMNSAYIGGFVGMQWNNQYSGSATHDENRLGSIMLGKRFDLKRWGVHHLTYTPEVAYVSQTATNASSAGVQWTQAIEFRVLQFAVFF